MGNIIQVKAASDFVSTALDVPKSACAFTFFISVLVLTLGKGKAIKAFTSYAIPLLCAVYVILCCALIFVFREAFPYVTRSIFTEAFTPKAGVFGFLGYLNSDAVRLGITRGVTSNEAGCGTAPIAYASEERAESVSSGLLGVIEVLVDTLLLCTLTAYAVLLPQDVLCADSAKSVIGAFESVFGSFISPVIAISVFLFALASVSAWAFYAECSAKEAGFRRCFNYFFTAAYPLTAFFGCFAPEKISWLLSDITVSLMAVINMTAILLLSQTVVSVTKSEAKAFGLK
jgi:AGCS family alanine or glycine:cation symporter